MPLLWVPHDPASPQPAPGEAPEPKTDEIRIVLADDHAVVRSALRMLLDAEPGLEVVAEAGDVDSAIRYVRGHQPEVLILDLNMPGRPSLGRCPSITEASPETQIVVLTMQSEPAFAREAMQAGVLGYILKEAADTELVKAVRIAARAGPTFSPTSARGWRPSRPTRRTAYPSASSRSCGSSPSATRTPRSPSSS